MTERLIESIGHGLPNSSGHGWWALSDPGSNGKAKVVGLLPEKTDEEAAGTSNPVDKAEHDKANTE